MDNIENGLCAPFVVELFKECLSGVKTGLDHMQRLAPLTEQNIVEMAGWRGTVIAPLTYLTLVKMFYPEIVQTLMGKNTDNFNAHITAIRMETDAVANMIADMIGRPESAYLDPPAKPQDANPFNGFTLMTLDMTQRLIDLCIKKIEAEGEITSGAKLTRIHGANCCLSAVLACVSHVHGMPSMMAMLGIDQTELNEAHARGNQFAQQTVERIQALGPKPH